MMSLYGHYRRRLSLRLCGALRVVHRRLSLALRAGRCTRPYSRQLRHSVPAKRVDKSTNLVLRLVLGQVQGVFQDFGIH